MSDDSTPSEGTDSATEAAQTPTESALVSGDPLATAASEPEPEPVTVLRTERHFGATDAFGYHLEIPGGYIEVEYLSDGSVRSADGAHPLHPSVFVRPPSTEE